MATQLIMDRWPQLIETVPELIESPGKLLYVGANKNRHHYMKELYDAGNEISVLEVWEPYVDGIRHKEMISSINIGDIREVSDIELKYSMYDYVLWWHGPEHITIHELAKTLYHIEKITKSIVILGSPWGKYPQGVVNGNPFETHEAYLDQKDYNQYGYETKTLGVRDVIDSNILAVKRLKPAKRMRRISFPSWLSVNGV